MLMIKISEDRKRNMFDLILLLLLIGIGVLSLSKMYLLYDNFVFVWIITRWEAIFPDYGRSAIMTIRVLQPYIYMTRDLKADKCLRIRLSRVTDMATLTTEDQLFAEY